MEVDTHLEFARRCAYLADEQVVEIGDLVTRCDKLLSGLRGALQRKLAGPPPHSDIQPPKKP